ncbi:hypothetical protein IFT48_03995 [Pseudomonas fluorescens]|uniref:hypothetical protein n=1 Tax=Pseudomonas fluorescens TaxID=294 RepID=UPI001930B22F|nr:hypothetical protein [Pseudomonas fluorescens]MBD8089133.1 hypothetical protein [Pseudomonas fluorescens]
MQQDDINNYEFEIFKAETYRFENSPATRKVAWSSIDNFYKLILECNEIVESSLAKNNNYQKKLKVKIFNCLVGSAERFYWSLKNEDGNCIVDDEDIQRYAIHDSKKILESRIGFMKMLQDQDSADNWDLLKKADFISEKYAHKEILIHNNYKNSLHWIDDLIESHKKDFKNSPSFYLVGAGEWNLISKGRSNRISDLKDVCRKTGMSKHSQSLINKYWHSECNPFEEFYSPLKISKLNKPLIESSSVIEFCLQLASYSLEECKKEILLHL